MAMLKLLRVIACLLPLAGLVTTSKRVQADIIYNLTNQNHGGLIATGTITTDGTLGAIGSANVISSNIVLTGNGTPRTLLSAPFAFGGVTATATELSTVAGISTVDFRDNTTNNRWLLRTTAGDTSAIRHNNVSVQQWQAFGSS